MGFLTGDNSLLAIQISLQCRSEWSRWPVLPVLPFRLMFWRTRLQVDPQKLDTRTSLPSKAVSNTVCLPRLVFRQKRIEARVFLAEILAWRNTDADFCSRPIARTLSNILFIARKDYITLGQEGRSWHHTTARIPTAQQPTISSTMIYEIQCLVFPHRTRYHPSSTI